MEGWKLRMRRKMVMVLPICLNRICSWLARLPACATLLVFLAADYSG